MASLSSKSLERFPLRREFALSCGVHPGWPVYHAADMGAAASDSALWQYARTRELAIVSKDADFSHRIMTAEPPPWVVHLRFGNLRRREFHAFLARLWPAIEALLPAHKLVNVYADRIEAVKGN